MNFYLLKTNLKSCLTQKYFISILLLWQFFSVLLVAIGIWPKEIFWLNFAFSVIYILFSESYYGLLYVIVSLPFSIALPIKDFDSFPLWRVLFVILFLRWLAQVSRGKTVRELARYIAALFFDWDKYLFVFIFFALASLFYAKFPLVGFKQLLFWGNIYLIYVLILDLFKTKSGLIRLMKYTAASLAIIVALGYVQLVATFFMNLGYFWVYWASFVSKIYYGQSFTSVLLYSNSWFSYFNGQTELRMFSIMPDSHSFAMLAVFCISFLLTLTYVYDKKIAVDDTQTQRKGLGIFGKRIQILDSQNKIFGYKVNYFLWSLIRFAGLAVVLSGTRAVWVGLLTPFVLVSLANFTKFFPGIGKKIFWPLLIIVFFFILSPFINMGLHYLQVSKFEENFLGRAKSIYDLSDESNMGRLEIWKTSINYSKKHLLGTGLGNFIVSITPDIKAGENYNQIAESPNRRFNLPQKFITAHNLYLQVLVELGLAGLVAFLAFWFSYFYKIELFLKRYLMDSNIFLFFVIETALTFVWFLTSAMFDVTFFNDKVLIYFFVSLAISANIIKNYELLKKDG